jgi:hypothetical protein
MMVLACTISLLATNQNLVPTGMAGMWVGNASFSPYGPRHISGPYMAISTPDDDGNVYFRHSLGFQLFRVQGSMVQYCFGYDHPESAVTGAETAPFLVSLADSSSLELCWRGPRLPSHAAGCTGCDCARWSLSLEGNQMTSTFLQSPPAIHMQAELTRSAHPVPSAESLRLGWNCTFVVGLHGTEPPCAARAGC